MEDNTKHIVLFTTLAACIVNGSADGRNGPVRCTNLFVAVPTITNTKGCYPVVAAEDSPS